MTKRSFFKSLAGAFLASAMELGLMKPEKAIAASPQINPHYINAEFEATLIFHPDVVGPSKAMVRVLNQNMPRYHYENGDWVAVPLTRTTQSTENPPESSGTA